MMWMNTSSRSARRISTSSGVTPASRKAATMLRPMTPDAPATTAWGNCGRCEALAAVLRGHVKSGAVVQGINHEMRDFKQNRKKDLDLVLARPRESKIATTGGFKTLGIFLAAGHFGAADPFVPVARLVIPYGDAVGQAVGGQDMRSGHFMLQ